MDEVEDEVLIGLFPSPHSVSDGLPQVSIFQLSNDVCVAPAASLECNELYHIRVAELALEMHHSVHIVLFVLADQLCRCFLSGCAVVGVVG